jgi:type VI protein secretion system component VasF
VTDTNWIIMIVVFCASAILWQLDRLGKQLEAVCANIKASLAPTEDREMEIIRDWKESARQQAKDQRRFFIFWGIVAAAIVGWHLLRQ